ncbi:MAG: SMP-30/gluconolactonase/LRE family protein [Opitutaceae bacterium]|nr:SMP-30/gluconolactonase/LRE family protein [Opitutaceae bacterium]
MKPILVSSLALIASIGLLQAAELQISNSAEFRKCVSSDAKLTKIAGDFGFTEGPTWLKSERKLVFSDIPNDELKQWAASGGVTSFRKPSRNANGNTTDAQGRLITCEHTGRRISIQEKGGDVKTLVDSFEGKKLNSPNDVAVKSDGTIWFTDPEYGLKNDPQTKKKIGKEQPGNHVYRYDPKTRRTTAVVRDFVQPNGIAFSPDEKKVYIADSGTPKHIRIFDVKSDGTLSDGKVFCKIDQGGPDGIRVDKEGRVWSSAGDGVQIFAPDGSLIGKILVPEAPANLCFGGEDGRTLFITARKSLYSIKVGVTGAGR